MPRSISSTSRAFQSFRRLRDQRVRQTRPAQARGPRRRRAARPRRTAIALVLTNGNEAPPEVLPNSVVRIDPVTLEPTQVVRVGDAPDLVVVAGGFVWVTNHGRRYSNNTGLRDAGDRTLTRVDPSTGDAVPVGGGLAPCGLTPDPSGDVWVANCFAADSGANATVVRVAARTLEFERRWQVPYGNPGYFRGLAYGGGSLWVADASGAVDYHGITQVDPGTGHKRTDRVPSPRGLAGTVWGVRRPLDERL